MLNRTLGIEVLTGTWRKPRRVPHWLDPNTTGSTIEISVIEAMLWLGTLTTPSALSSGSPERYWACARYFSACTPESDLRIRQPFLTLDPHQRGILSDDFGVALSTCWIANQLKARDIVDGRLFALNYGLIKKPRRRRRLPKTGANKCPDYIIEDEHGVFHILECKGTQSAGYLKGAMTTGRIQKRSITFGTKITGERLVAGLRLRGEGKRKQSSLRISDPDAETLVHVSTRSRQKADRVIRRLGAARALNLAGLTELSSELIWKNLKPNEDEQRMMYPAEIEVAKLKYDSPSSRTAEEIDRSLRKSEQRDGVLQSLTLQLPEFDLRESDAVNSVKIERGISPHYLLDLKKTGNELREAVELGADDDSRIVVETNKQSITLNYGGFAWTRFTFDRR